MVRINPNFLMFKSLCWNIRVGNKSSCQQLWYLLNLFKVDVFSIIEPLIPLDSFVFCKKFKMEKVISNCSNKIWLFEILIDHEQFLHCKIVSELLPSPVLMTIVYAKCNRREIMELWEELRNIAVWDIPWVIGGYFNIVANSDERLGGSSECPSYE